MAFSDDDLAHIHATVGALVERRQAPPHLRDQIRHELEIDGHRVRIWTVRPRSGQPDQTVRSGVAQFTYAQTTNQWTLSWMRRDGKWHAWDTEENGSTLEDLVRAVADDRYGGFWR